MAIGISDIRTGTKIQINGDPYVVVSVSHSKQARQGAILRTNLRNMLTGRTLPKTFSGNDKVEEANVAVKSAQFLYHQGDAWFFMEDETFDQYSLTTEQLGDAINYLTEDMTVSVMKYNDNPVSIELPRKVALEVKFASPGTRGDTASGSGTKEIELETGLKLQVPLFIEQGTKIIVNTETGQYVERA